MTVLVIFSGLDGAGKSTQIEFLCEWFLKSGRKHRLLWARGGYTPFFQGMKRFIRRILGQRLPGGGDTAQRKQAMRQPWVARLWLRIAILDLMLYWAAYLRLQRFLGHVIICDRYIDDTRLDFRRNFPTVAFECMWLWRMLERLTPAPDAAFLLWVPVEESIRRSREKGEPFPDDEETLAWRLQAYKADPLFTSERYLCLDGRGSVSEISEEIVGNVAECLDKCTRLHGG